LRSNILLFPFLLQSILPFLLQSLSSGAFPTLRLFALDEVRLTAHDAARFVEALAKGCEGVKVLKLGKWLS
jgi:hypothetical protein